MALDEKILSKIAADKLGFFRFRKLDAVFLLANETGRFEFLEENEFEQFLSGALPDTNPVFKALTAKGFLRAGENLDELKKQWLSRNAFLGQGPGLHIMVVTLRCDHRCVYCHAGAHKNDAGCDMSRETARRVVDIIFSAPGKNLSIEFQGGEPLLNWPVVRFTVEYAAKKERETGKSAQISLVTNMSLMDGDKLDFLLKNNVSLCTSLDGPERLHNANRVLSRGDSHANTVKWFRLIAERGKQPIGALLTVTKASLPLHREIVDEYINIGAQNVFLRFLSPLGAARQTWAKIGYTAGEFLEFYAKALDYIIDRNLGGAALSESTATLFLSRIMSDVPDNFLDLRSPCGAGIGQIAYNYDGKVFTCDEGRMLYEMGDASFCIGDAEKDDYSQIVSHPAVACMATASCLEAQSLCPDCVYKPYCGVCPVLNYAAGNDLYAHPGNMRCEIYRGILDIIFKRIRTERGRQVFTRWLEPRGIAWRG